MAMIASNAVVCDSFLPNVNHQSRRFSGVDWMVWLAFLFLVSPDEEYHKQKYEPYK